MLDNVDGGIVVSELIQRHNNLKEAVQLALKESKNFDGLSGDILTNVVISTINTYQKKLNVGVQDSVSDLMETFKQKVSEAIFSTARGWRIANREGYLLPRGCRFCFDKGQSTVVIIEQAAQMRTLLFEANMLGERVSQIPPNNTERISLALPYTYFILHFKNNTFSTMYHGWRSSMIHSLDDMLSPPLLPNIHENLNVCTGHDLNVQSNSISEQTDQVLSHFWNSKFNNDLSTRWWSKQGVDMRLNSARSWSEQSRNDFTFILGVRFPTDPLSGARTVKSVIELCTMHEEEPDENALRHRLSEAIDSSVESLFSKIMRYFKKTKFDKYHPKDILEAVSATMIGASGELSDMMLAVQHELDNLKGDVEASKKPKSVVGSGPFWEDYSP